MNFVLKTNSAYSYLWPIINDLTKNFNKLNILVDNLNEFEFNKNIKVHYYDINDKYPVRLKKYLNNIDSDYVFLIHDVDLILNFNFELFEKYLNLVKEKNIHRLSFGVFDGLNLITNNSLSICKLDKQNMSQNFLTPFDYAPSIFNKNFLIDIYSKFENETYKTLEHNNNLQEYIVKNYNSYGLQKTNNLKINYHRGFSYSQDFNFLHLTVSGEFLKDQCYEDLLTDFLNIKQKYNLNFIKTHNYVPGPSSRL